MNTKYIITLRILDKRMITLLHSILLPPRQTAMQESQVLKNCLNKAQFDLEALLTEKQTLLNTVRSLQQQLLVKSVTAGSGASSPDGATAPGNR